MSVRRQSPLRHQLLVRLFGEYADTECAAPRLDGIRDKVGAAVVSRDQKGRCSPWQKRSISSGGSEPSASPLRWSRTSGITKQGIRYHKRMENAATAVH